MTRNKILILGAAGRDFHNFNMVYRHDPACEVVGFTAAQIPGIDTRIYPAELSGPLYPTGLPIWPERDFEARVRELEVDTVVLAYSDLAHAEVMHLASRALAAGANFQLLGPRHTMVRAERPVIAVCAVRTGCGKSQTTRFVADRLREHGKKAVIVRHPMPYGDLAAQAVQRLASYADLERHACTIEEREEYELHIDRGYVVYAGVDYQAIVRRATQECDVLLWDGGNNDLPFVQPDLWVTVADPLRPGHETEFYPGEANLRAADVVVVAKATDAPADQVQAVRRAAQRANPSATVLSAGSRLVVPDGEQLRGKRVLLVDDGPTLTHGGMPFGAAQVAALRCGAGELADPRPHAVGSIAQTFSKYPHLQHTLPAMGYSASQVAELEATIAATPCDVVVYATPIDLGRLLRLTKAAVRVQYEYEELEQPGLGGIIDDFARLLHS